MLKKARSTTTKPETTFEEMMNAIGDCLRDLETSEDEEEGDNGDDDEEDTEVDKLSEDDEAGWVMDTISNMVQQRIESFRQKQIRLDELTPPGWSDVANDLRERVMKYGTNELNVPAVVKPQTDTTVATPSPTTFGEHMQVLDIVLDNHKCQK